MIALRHASTAIAAVLFSATSGFAQAPQTHEFTVAQTTYTVPVPAGYCLPSGANVAAAEAIAALDKDNITHAEFQLCGSYGEAYTHIKSLIGGTPVNLPKAVFIALLAREIQTASGQETVAAAMEETKGHIAKETDNGLVINSQVPVFAGQDDDCAYMLATFNVTAGEVVTEVRGAVCMTLVGQQFFAVNSYARAVAGVTDEALKARSAAVAASIRRAE